MPVMRILMLAEKAILSAISVARRTDGMMVQGAENMFCGGEKSGLFVGHTEAITTGSLAGYNACRYLKGIPLAGTSRRAGSRRSDFLCKCTK